MKKQPCLYMAVTADKYELPLFVTDDPQEMADKYGISKHNLYVLICHGQQGKGKRKAVAKRWYRRVILDDEQEV